MVKILLLLLAMFTGLPGGYAKMRTDTIGFTFEGRRYSGLIDLPEQKAAAALVILVPGSGKTSIVAGNWFYEIRSHFTEHGLACLVWDKMGCGKSEGVFDYNQTVQNSAGEVIAAITEAKSRNIPGAEKIGLWGISRAGWIWYWRSLVKKTRKWIGEKQGFYTGKQLAKILKQVLQ